MEKGKGFVHLLDKLMATGVVSAYGIDVDMLPVPGEHNVAFWAEVSDWSALDKMEQALDEFEKANPSLISDLRAMADPATHHDLSVGTREQRVRSVPVGSQPAADFDIAKVKPGRMDDYMALFRKYDKPVLDKLVSDGSSTPTNWTRKPCTRWSRAWFGPS